jgi:hypothetical protein
MQSKGITRCVMATVTLAVAGCASIPGPTSVAQSNAHSFLGSLGTVSQLASTVAPNGDVNPYGVAIVPTTIGHLVAGATLVSNFNDKANIQGTGTTIMEIPPHGSAHLFSQISHLGTGLRCPGGVGLDTALTVLPGGWVVVGSLPTVSGGAVPGIDPAGCLLILNADGTPVETISNKNLVGPWDMTFEATASRATLFVANALGGEGSINTGPPMVTVSTVVRFVLSLSASRPPRLVSATIVGSGFPWVANRAVVVLAPTGLALGRNGTLYVDDTQRNTISAIPAAVTRTDAVDYGSRIIASAGAFDAPLGMAMAPNGDLIVVNGNDGSAVEVTPTGSQIDSKTLIRNGAGDLIGLTVTPNGRGIEFANDGTNALDLVEAV